MLFIILKLSFLHIQISIEVITFGNSTLALRGMAALR